ncbi:MAG TPA: hypothetical protein V6D11_17225 [Waterburya sp.]
MIYPAPAIDADRYSINRGVYSDSRLSEVQLTSALEPWSLKTISPVPHPDASCYRRL